MMSFKILSVRLVMSILFMAALSTTFQAISGVDAKSVFHSIQQYMGEDVVRSNFNHNLNSNDMALHSSVKADMQNSSSKETPKLENEIDWTKYPVKKVVATGYTAGYESTGKSPNHPEFGITYSGVKVKRDLFSTVAADLNVFPIGTILFIPDYGFGVVADKGGAIKGNRVDLYYETVDDVYNHWGKKETNVYVVEMGDGSLTENELMLLNEDKSMQVFRQQYINPERK